MGFCNRQYLKCKTIILTTQIEKIYQKPFLNINNFVKYHTDKMVAFILQLPTPFILFFAHDIKLQKLLLYKRVIFLFMRVDMYLFIKSPTPQEGHLSVLFMT